MIRIQEHWANVNHSRTSISPLAKHIKENENHQFSWDSVEVLDKENKIWRRKFKESIHIRKNKSQTINSNSGVAIDQVWMPLLFSLVN